MSNSGAHQLQPGSFNQPLADASLVACHKKMSCFSTHESTQF